jgi:hypothetical protein
MMKTKLILLSLSIIYILAACQSATPPPSLTVATNQEFTLAPDQSATITDADLTNTFNSVLSDDRCPSEVECVASGPVTVSLSIQQGNEAPSNITLQTFTDQNGRSPTGQFEGITDRVEVGDNLVQIVGVTPYPKDPSTKIEPSEYRVSLVVSKK